MNSRLILYVHEHWPQQPSLAWVLLDERDQRVQEGHSEPRHWPAAAQCEVVLGGPQTLWLEPELPKAPRREQERLLAYALEDRLASDPDSQHLTITHRHAGDKGQRVGVLVVARLRLRNILAQLQAIGRAPTRVASELQYGERDGSSWLLSCAPGGALVLHEEGTRRIPVDADNLPLLLEHELARARAANNAPQHLDIHASSQAELPALASPGLPLHEAQSYPWWDIPARAENLLHGEFSARQHSNHWLQPLRRPLQLAAGVAALYVLSLGVELGWQRYQLSHTEARMARLFETTLPRVPAVAPSAQLHRELELRRANRGLLREDDALALLLAYTEARGTGTQASVRGMDYENGRLRLNLAAVADAQRDALVERLQERGVRAVASTGNPNELTLTREASQ